MQSGVKRKHEEDEEAGDTGLSGEGISIKERQSILDISMLKLRCSPIKRVEPSLRRSVLIFNTLRHIEYELKQEGVPLNPAAKSSLPLLPAFQSTDVDLDPLPGSDSLTNQNAAPGSLANQNAAPGCMRCGVAIPAHGHQDSVCSTRGHECIELSLNIHADDTPHGTDSSSHTPHESCSSVSNSNNHHGNTSSHHGNCSSNHGNCDSTHTATTAASTAAASPESNFSILDSLLSNEKLLTVASFTSLFEPSNSSISDQNSSSTAFPPPFSSSCSSMEHVPSSVTTLPSLPNSCSGSTNCSEGLTSSPNGALYSSATAVAMSLPSATTMGPYRSESQPDLFADLDLSVFDLELFVPLASNMKFTPLSTEDIVHSLPTPAESFCGFTGGFSNGAASCNPKNDLLGDELDHIMQILVGI